MPTPSPDTSQRYDSIRLDLADPKVRVEKLENGMVRIHNPVVSRAGVFVYLNADGSERRELRHPDEVFSADSRASFANQVVTVLHPGLVTADNAQTHQVGSIGDSLFRDGLLLRASTITLQQSRGVDAARSGSPLSLGYTQHLVVEDGTFQGSRFDARQTVIRGNHVALVPAGKAGAVASLPRFDSASHTTMGISPKPTEGEMPRMTIDGVEHEVPDGLIAPIKAVQAAAATARQDAKDARAQVQTLETGNVTLQGLLDTAKAERMDADAIEKLVAAKAQARFDLLSKWSDVLPETFVASKATTADIKRAAIKVTLPEMDTSTWNEQRLDDSLLVIEQSSLSSAAAKADRKAKVNDLRADATGASNSAPTVTPAQAANNAQFAYARRNNGVPMRNARTRDQGGAS